MDKILRIGGVPEHFSEPMYQLLAENNAFNSFVLTWSDYPTGTGAMVADLLAGKLDMAIALTEGLVYAICKNKNAENRFKIIHPFVNSPIVWGVHTGIANPDINPQDTIAISRIGSGSHIMSLVYGHQKSWQTQETQFLPISNLVGGIDALEKNTAQRFMWEKFMTQPYIDAKKVKRVDECPTPWASFMIVCNEKISQEHKKGILLFLERLRQKNISFQANTNNINTNNINTDNINIDNINTNTNNTNADNQQQQANQTENQTEDNIQKIAKKFHLLPQDVKRWWNTTQWATNNEILEMDLLKIYDILQEIKLFDGSFEKGTENVQKKLAEIKDFVLTDFCTLV